MIFVSDVYTNTLYIETVYSMLDSLYVSNDKSSCEIILKFKWLEVVRKTYPHKPPCKMVVSWNKSLELGGT